MTTAHRLCKRDHSLLHWLLLLQLAASAAHWLLLHLTQRVKALAEAAVRVCTCGRVSWLRYAPAQNDTQSLVSRV